MMVRAAGLEPAQPISEPTDFLTSYGFRRRQYGVCGLDYPFTLAFALGAARLVSTPSRCRAWLGIAISGSPDFEQFCTSGFPEGTQIESSPLRLPIPPRPHPIPSTAIPPASARRNRQDGGPCSSSLWSASDACFLGFGRLTLIAAASRLVAICEA